jgi:hypothetical protein
MVIKKRISLRPSAEPITGSDLLKRINELGDMDIMDKARICGYYHTSRKLGIRRVNIKGFYEKFIEANNLKPVLGVKEDDVIHVNHNKLLVIPSAYVNEAGAAVSDKFEINVDRDGLIHLIPIRYAVK